MRTLEDVYGKFEFKKIEKAEPVRPYQAQVSYGYYAPPQPSRQELAEAWDYIFKDSTTTSKQQAKTKVKEPWQNMATNKEYWGLLAEGKTPAQARKIIYAKHKLEKLRQQDSSIVYYNDDFVVTYDDLGNAGVISLIILIPLAIHLFIKKRNNRIDLSSINPSKLK